MARRFAEHSPACRAEFARAVTCPDAEVDLARAALLMAKEEYPCLDVAAYLGQLDALAEEARPQVQSLAAPRDALAALNACLFEAHGFRGNTADYYDPRNSFLNEVLDRRMGIPITLAIVYLEVGRRLGLVVEGVGMPGHFLVRQRAGEEALLLDPFNAGKLLSVEDCQGLLDRIFHGKVAFEPRFLDTVSPRQILTRMLHNLKVIYFNARDYEHAVSVVERLLVLHPDSAAEVRDRGLLLSQLKAYAAAARDLERYLRMAAGAEDTDVIRSHLRSLRQRIVVLN